MKNKLNSIVKRVISEKTKNSRRPLREFNPFGGGDGPSTETATEAIVQYPGDKTWEYTQIDDVWNTRKAGSDKWISLADSKYKSTIDRLDKAFPQGAKGGGEAGGSEEEQKSSFMDMFKPCVKKYPTKNDRAYNIIFDAVDGWGTDERKLFRALDELNTWDEWVSMNKVIKCATKFGKTMWGTQKGFDNMYDFIADDLRGNDLREFRTILRALKQTKGQTSGGDAAADGGPAGGTGTTGKATVPFKDKTEGDEFRKWINYKYPDYAKEIKLDPSGPFNNEYIAKAYAKYGEVYQRVQKASA